jgi:16S rRNA (cytidine1402-2'-O)-methyltransferase
VPLYILPNVFSDEQSPMGLLPEGLSEIITSLNGLIAESERTGRRYLLKMLPKSDFARSLPIVLLNEHSLPGIIGELTRKITKGETWGLISDAGLPILADPGSNLVAALRDKGYDKIIAIPGPSSIILALLLSGFNGQKYTFNGYPPKEKADRLKVLRAIEKDAVPTHIFIETPYRNQAFFQDCLEALSGGTKLCLATALTLPMQQLQVHTVDTWKKSNTEVPKEPTVFLVSKPEKPLARMPSGHFF